MGRVSVLCLVGLFVVLSGCATAQQSGNRPKVPEKLQLPAGQHVLLHAFGKGDQVYTCSAKDGGFAWSLKEPEARLTGEDGNLVGRHFAGPTWAAEDGSRVIGKVVASEPSPDQDAIPWLLLTATEHVGDGRMKKVLSIQRVNTQAGKAPNGRCDEYRKGNVVRVPYAAEYWFWGM